MPYDVTLLKHTPLEDPDRATVHINTTVRSPHRVSRWLLGKFCEHLGTNIYGGMDAQILFNPTFGCWSFGQRDQPLSRPDGGAVRLSDPQRIALRIYEYERRFGLHPAPLLQRDLADGCAFGWVRLGKPANVETSPDTGPYGDRAQRFEVYGDSPSGLAQRAYLPLHRTRGYVYRLVGRAVGGTRLHLHIASVQPNGETEPPLTTAEVALGEEWTTVEGALQLPDGVDPQATYEIQLVAPSGANVVLDRVLLYPDDHVNYADPDVIRFLRESKLPLLRWPGGNFVSGYHWRDGIGPVDARPTLPNPAWEGLEYNLFGTDEFIAFCREVGCEPMICINAGSGTPEEAAAWVEYCNGSPDTPMGRLRAENGHPEPYGVKFWELGNELYGRWQIRWSTPGGYVDRCRRFARAMLAADPSITLLALGFRREGLAHEWNQRLIDESEGLIPIITDHLLTGGIVADQTDPNELYDAFMGYASVLGELYVPMVERMRERGIEQPRIAVTELQLFAHYGERRHARPRMRPEDLPTPATISEAVYLMTLVHEFIRMGDVVGILTHSATVNHGGGLRKERQRVWANPVHYAHQIAAKLIDATPVQVSLQCATYETGHSFGETPVVRNVPNIDALAAITPDGKQLVLSLAHRTARCGAIELEIAVDREVAPEAQAVVLQGESMTDANTLDAPERIVPRSLTLPVTDKRIQLTLQPFTVLQITFDLG